MAAATASVNGYMTSTYASKLDGIATGATANTGTVTSITAGTGLSGGTITTTGTIALATTAVTAGSYTNASVTVDAYGRLTSASSGTAPVTSVSATSPVASSGGTTPTISMAAASSGVNGYMTGTYATKLDGIAAGATVNTGNVNSGTANQLAYYGSTGTTLSGSVYLTYQDNSLYVNNGGATDLRLTYNLPGVTAPGVTSTGASIAMASGFNNSTGAYTAGILITNAVDTSASFSGSVSGNTSGNAAMNLGTSVAPWKKFYWGNSSTGIAAPSGNTTTFLRNDGTWATPPGLTSVGLSVPTGLTVTGSPLTSNGSLTVTFTSGYSIPTTSKQTDWDTAYTDRNKWDGGSTGLTASTGRTSLGGTTVGQAFFTLTNPSAVTFPRMNADNTVSSLTASDFRTAIGAAAAYTGGTGITVSGSSISIDSGLAANTTVFTNNQVIGGVTVGTTSSIGGFQAKNELSAGFFTKTLNALSGGLVGIYLTTTADGNGVVTTSAIKHTSSSTSAYRPDIGDSTTGSTGGRFGKVYATTADFSGAVATGTLTVTGSITASGDITAYSDERLKTNIKTISDPFKGVDDIYGVTYDRTDIDATGMGFLAQKFQKHYPDIVAEGDDGTLSLKYMSIIAILWEQNRELNTRLKALEDKYGSTNN